MSRPSTSNSPANVIWAIDPLANNPEKLANSKKVLAVLRKKKKLKVLPVSLLLPEDLYLPVNAMAPWGKKLQTLTEKSLKPFLKSLHIKNMAEPGVLLSSSKTKSIDAFLAYAKNQKAEMIFTATHEKNETDKYRIGKFTQKLIERSPIPVMSIRPSSEVPNHFSRILFPTDFSKTSEKSYIKLLKIAKELGSQIIVYHNMYDPVLPAAEFTGIPTTQYQIITYYTHKMEIKERNKIIHWKKLAEKAGVNFEYKGDRSNLSLGKAILMAARKSEVQMIALGIESHPLARAFFGSSVREIIGLSSKPVLVINSPSHRRR